jgi:phosphoribosyl 1,2-cyclic phosphodiesterase
MEEGGQYHIGNVELKTPLRHTHGVETYGVNFVFSGLTLSYVSDSRFTERMAQVYRGEILILNVVRLKPSDLDHLCIQDAKAIIESVRPELAVLTHFGMTLLKAKPWVVADEMSRETGVKVIAARDGMTIDLGEYVEA